FLGLVHGVLDRLHIEAVMRREFLVLARDQRDRQFRGNLLTRDPMVFEREIALAGAPGRDPALEHERRRRRRYEAQQQYDRRGGGDPQQRGDEKKSQGATPPWTTHGWVCRHAGRVAQAPPRGPWSQRRRYAIVRRPIESPSQRPIFRIHVAQQQQRL